MSAKRAILNITLALLFAGIFQSARVFAQNPSYKVSYSTYLGGDDYSSVTGVDVDAAGNIYVVGTTRSAKLIVTENAIGKERKEASLNDTSFLQVISPTGKLIYSTYLNNCSASKIKVDSDGFVYLVGQVYSSSLFYTSPNAFQSSGGNTFVMKIDVKTGKIIYSTRLGGKDGSDSSWSIDVDKQGDAFVAGNTESDDFPTTPNALQKTFAKTGKFQSGGFVTKLNSTGTALLYSTVLVNTGRLSITDLKIDSDGNANVAGFTDSPSLLTTANAYQNKFRTNFIGDRNGFFVKLNADGNKILYSTFIGGSDSYCGSLAIDDKGNIYLAGTTNSDGFTTTKNAYQPALRGKYKNIFVVKFNKSLSDLEYSTFLGGIHSSVSKIAVDAEGKVYLVGGINSSDFPSTKDAYQKHWGRFNLFIALLSDEIPGDAFLSVLDASGNQLVYSTFIGGLGDDGASGVALDADENIYVVGSTESSKFPITRDALQKHWKSEAGFLTEFSKSK